MNRTTNGAGNATGTPRRNYRPPSAELSGTPRDLYILWEEYIYGIGGRKAAKFFTPQERGRVKHKYCRRNRFWKLVDTLVASGLTAKVAIDTIYQVYGTSSTVTSILNRLGADIRQGNLHERLRVGGQQAWYVRSFGDFFTRNRLATSSLPLTSSVDCDSFYLTKTGYS